MTYKEKLEKINPHIEPMWHCPSTFFKDAQSPKDCFPKVHGCCVCWNQEYKGEEVLTCGS